MNRALGRALSVLYLACVLWVAIAAARAPEWNFDLVGYVAAAQSWSGGDAKVVHERTYRSIAEVATPGAQWSLVESSAYRRALHEKPAYLATQIPFYTAKPGYVALAFALHRLGLNVATATYVISAIAYGVLGVLVLVWFRRHVSPASATLLSAAFMLLQKTRALAGYSTPDVLSALVLGLGSFLALELGRFRLAMALVLLACLVRPDNLLFGVILLGWFAWQGNAAPRPLELGLCLLALVGTCWALNTLTGAYPWGVLAKHTFVERLYEPQRMGERITAAEYGEALIHGLRPSPRYSSQRTALSIFAGVSVLPLVFRIWLKRVAHAPRALELLTLGWTSIAAHYVCFPLLEDRYFICAYLVIAIGAALGLANFQRTPEL